VSDPFDTHEDYLPVPPSAVDADPAQTIRELMFRVSKLEQDLAERDTAAQGDLAEVMVDLVSISDELNQIVQRWGIATNAQEAAMVRALVSLGRKIQQALAKQEVKQISVVGQPYNAQTSEITGTEVTTSVIPNTVLRESEPAYTWKGGLLRKAQVVVASRSEG